MWNPQSGSSGISLQGGRGISLQGSSSNPQQTLSVGTLQPAANPMDYPASANVSYGYTEAPAAQVAPVYVDPYAKWGGRAGYDNLVSGFNTQKNGIFDSSNEAATASGIGLKNSILDWIDSMRSGQTALDNRGINNELAKRRGTADVYSSVGTGVRSGGVKLANMNSVDSSASDAIARAYGDIGRRQLSDIGNQYETEKGNIGLAQDDLNVQRASGMRRFESAQEAAINSIISDATDKLTALDTAMANASLPDRIAIDQEKQRIRNSIGGILGNYTADRGQANSINPMDLQGRVSEANKRYSMGQVPSAQFNYTTEAPATFSNSGPYASELPIFTYRSNRDR